MTTKSALTYFPNALWGQSYPHWEPLPRWGPWQDEEGFTESLTSRVGEWNLKEFQGIPSPIIQMDQCKPNMGRDCARKHEWPAESGAPTQASCPLVQGSVHPAALGGALNISCLPSSSTYLLLNMGREGHALSRGQDRQASWIPACNVWEGVLASPLLGRQ